jgi:hypothetical protein
MCSIASSTTYETNANKKAAQLVDTRQNRRFKFKQEFKPDRTWKVDAIAGSALMSVSRLFPFVESPPIFFV